MRSRFYLLTVVFVASFASEAISTPPPIAASPEKLDLLTIAMPLKTLDVDEVAPQIKKLLGPFGEVAPMKGKWFNYIILRDTADNLPLIRQMIEDVDKDEKLAPPRRLDPRAPRSSGVTGGSGGIFDSVPGGG